MRPFSLTLLCLFSFVFFGITGILFLALLFYPGWLAGIINQYLPESRYTAGKVVLITLSGFLLHALAVTGVGLMWKMRKEGYLLFGGATLIISAGHLLLPGRSFPALLVGIALLILFGIHYRRFR